MPWRWDVDAVSDTGYKPTVQPSDTEPWADEMQIELLRKAGPSRRFQIACQLSAMVWNAARHAFDRLYPEETEDQRDCRFLTEIYGGKLAKKFIAHRKKVLGPRNKRLKK